MTRRDRQAAWFSLAIGLLATVGVLVAYATGRLQRIELGTLDFRFKHANRIQPDPRIVIVAIDDTALTVIGRWPWPRSWQASLIDLCAELGARRTLADLLWDEPEGFRAALPSNSEMFLSPREMNERLPQTEFPDLQLAAACAEAGNVYMSFGLTRQSPESLMRAPEFQSAVDAALANDSASVQRWIAALTERRKRPNSQTTEPVPADCAERARLVAYFQQFPVAPLDEALADTRIQSTQRLTDDYDTLRKEALRRLSRQFLETDAEFRSLPWFEQTRRACSDATGKPFDPDGFIARLMMPALRAELGDDALRRSSQIVTAAPILATNVETVKAPYFLLLREAKRAGFVEFIPDPEDGVVRRLALFARHGDRLFPQLAVAAALDELNISGADLDGEPGVVRFGQSSEPLTVQVDPFGQALVPWVPQLVDGDKKTASHKRFAQVPVDSLWSLHVTRDTIERNQAEMVEKLGRLHEQNVFPLSAKLRGAVADFLQLKNAEKAALLEQRWSDHKAARANRKIAGDAIRTAMPELESSLAALAKSLETLDDKSPEAEQLRELIDMGNEVITLNDANQRLAAELPPLEARLRGLLTDKIVLIGYTATALADSKPIPTEANAPGVLGHANLLNGLLTGQMVSWLPNWANLFIAACAGVLSTLISARLRPRLGLLLIAFSIVAFLAIAGFIAFYRYRLWVALTPGVAALFVPYLLISVYRYVFIDSERRHLATTLGQYTSKQIAKQMAENPELCRRAESREVTAMFTDLKGFTTISERIGAERTQKVLNICLGRFTEVMLHHGAMVNKFIGDGIFAFWNPVIFPQPDHALMACETAIDLQAALIALQQEMKKRGGDDVFSELELRIGVATGNAIVGPCGSEQKYDYTCIGDSVNLAARLESANKAFGTLILVAGPARDIVGDRFVFRYLGGVQVKGKAKAVPVYELLGRHGAVATDLAAYAERFAAGVAHFQARRWADSRAVFDECLRTRPGELAAESYLEQTARYANSPPAADWNGAIELMEK